MATTAILICVLTILITLSYCFCSYFNQNVSLNAAVPLTLCQDWICSLLTAKLLLNIIKKVTKNVITELLTLLIFSCNKICFNIENNNVVF